MNPEEFICSRLSRDLIAHKGRPRNAQKTIIKKCIKRYKLGNYSDLEELLSESRLEITKIWAIGYVTTSKEFSHRMGLSWSTARKILLETEYVKIDKSRTPFIYRSTL